MEQTETDDIQYIANLLGFVREHHLEAEVVYFAIKAMKNNPQLTIKEAFEAGCEEWDL